MIKKKEESPKKWNLIKLDSTIAMANKYRNEAKKDIVDKIVLNDNIVNALFVSFVSDPISIGKKCFTRYSIN